MAPMTISEAVRAAYGGRMNQSALAEAIRKDQTTVSKWATGKIVPSIDDLRSIEVACDRPLGFILRAAGYVEDAIDLESAVAADHELDDAARRLVLALIREAKGGVDARPQKPKGKP